MQSILIPSLTVESLAPDDAPPDPSVDESLADPDELDASPQPAASRHRITLRVRSVRRDFGERSTDREGAGKEESSGGTDG